MIAGLIADRYINQIHAFHLTRPGRANGRTRLIDFQAQLHTIIYDGGFRKGNGISDDFPAPRCPERRYGTEQRSVPRADADLHPARKRAGMHLNPDRFLWAAGRSSSSSIRPAWTSPCLTSPSAT